MARDKTVSSGPRANVAVECEWGRRGILDVAATCDVAIIVDTLSFSTAVEIATARRAVVYPYRFRDESARGFAASVGGIVAHEMRSLDVPSLSPTSLQRLPAETRLVLPSPNGSTLSLDSPVLTLAGCLRNSRAVADFARRRGRTIAVIPAGEHWPDGTVRPAFEDLVAAGAIISHLSGMLSPESEAALAVFEKSASRLDTLLMQCTSGRELVERGFAEDVLLAARLDCSDCVPVLMEGCYRRVDG